MVPLEAAPILTFPRKRGKGLLELSTDWVRSLTYSA